MANKPPLWQVLQSTFNEDVGSFCLGDGFGETCGDPDPGTWSAMIRALADWLKLDGPKPKPDGPQPGGSLTHYHQRLAVWEERQRIFQILFAEAARAEAGDG